jgi:hypothetical protein
MDFIGRFLPVPHMQRAEDTLVRGGGETVKSIERQGQCNAMLCKHCERDELCFRCECEFPDAHSKKEALNDLWWNLERKKIVTSERIRGEK